MEPKTIILVEDEPIILQSLITFINIKSNFPILDSFDSVENLLETKRTKNPDILILDIGLPGMSGIEGIPHIKKKFPNIDIIMLTTYEENDKIFAALCAGACSYISKRMPLSKILDAIQIVSLGGSYMSPSIAKKITLHFQSTIIPKENKLSPRQNEIIKLIVAGKSYAEIATICFISINTVRTHIKRIYESLSINSKIELVKKYMNGEI